MPSGATEQDSDALDDGSVQPGFHGWIIPFSSAECRSCEALWPLSATRDPDFMVVLEAVIAIQAAAQTEEEHTEHAATWKTSQYYSQLRRFFLASRPSRLPSEIGCVLLACGEVPRRTRGFWERQNL